VFASPSLTFCTRIMQGYLATELTLSEGWNSGTKSDPHIGSLLLPFEFVPSIAVFCLLEDAEICEVWLMKGGAVFGFATADEELKERLRVHHEGDVRHNFYPRPSDRNVHQMSGRIT
jgi:hypothetical protein